MRRIGSYLFTSESVTEGHPDKICDQVSDAVLDAIMREDKNCRVAVETLVKTGYCMIAGEVTTSSYVELPEVVRQTIKEIGYNRSNMGFDWETCGVLTAIEQQSSDIAQGVNEGAGLFDEQGAGDQGLMFGFACDETTELMPAPIQWSHQLTKELASARKQGRLEFLRPDGKSQVTVEYLDGKIKRIDAIVVSSQHRDDATYDQIKEGIMEEVVKKALPSELIDGKTRMFINPTGRFVTGGPVGDCGLTGRKIIVDTYGGYGRHGGGAFSGKDPSKVDRTASYMARYIAKNVVASKMATMCEVELAYAIGVAEPLAVYVDTFGTSKISDDRWVAVIRDVFPLKPKDMIEKLNLLRPIYRQTASYGHFGRSGDSFTWEKTDMVDTLKSKLG
jgi:S-adenosylmethionine synthetase